MMCEDEHRCSRCFRLVMSSVLIRNRLQEYQNLKKVHLYNCMLGGLEQSKLVSRGQTLFRAGALSLSV